MKRHKLRSFYGVAELAKLGGETRKSMMMALKVNGVPLHRHGLKVVVYLGELKTIAPAIWQSIVECDAIREKLKDQ